MRKFTPEEDQFLRDNYLTIPTKRMSKMLGRTEGTARQRMKLIGVVVPREIIEKFKRESRYQPGRTPENKGLKMPERVYEKVKATMFKKGTLPPNTMHDGAVTVRNDEGRKYKYIRLSKAKWQPLHVNIWEKLNGPVPKGMIVVFKDGDTMNCIIDNLEMITRVENMNRNTYHRYPKEIANLVQLGGALTRQINKRIKKLSNEKQNQ